MIFSVRRRSFFIATIALWFATSLSAQNDGGWKNASGDRYGGAAESTTNNPFAATAGNQGAPAAAPRGAGDITPIGGGLAPVAPAQPAPRSPKAAARCPTTRARCGASTTFARTRSASAPPPDPSRRSSTGSSAKPATKRGTPIRSACSAPTAKCSASTTRRRCKPSWPTSSTASSTPS